MPKRRAPPNTNAPHADVDEEAALSRFVFGSGPAASTSTTTTTSSPDQPLFSLDNLGVAAGAAGADPTSSSTPAWSDPDDDVVTVDASAVDRLRKLRKTQDETTLTGAQYTERLRERFQSSAGASAAWAEKPGGVDDDDPLISLLRTSKKLVSRSAVTARGVELHVNRLKDANAAAMFGSVVSAVDWHPSSPAVVLGAGLDKKLRLFRVGAGGGKLRSIHFADLPIRSAAFAGPTAVVASGRRPFYYACDLETGAASRVRGIFGRSEGAESLENMAVAPNGDALAFALGGGVVSVVSRRSARETLAVAVEGSAECVVLAPDGSLYAASDKGVVYKWDPRHAGRRPLWQLADRGASAARALAVCGSRLAVGSAAGVVNVYEEIPGGRLPELRREIMNLTTPVDVLAFDPQGALLALASKQKADALRVFHVASNRVVSNWPTERTPLSHVQCAGFSSDSRSLVVGNDKGKMLLFNVKI